MWSKKWGWKGHEVRVIDLGPLLNWLEGRLLQIQVWPLQVIELIFDAAVEVLDHASEEAIPLGSDRANELRAVVGLDGDLREVEAMGAEVIQAGGNGLGGVEGHELKGMADESSTGEHVFHRVFELGQDAAQHEGVDLGDIVQILDVDLPVGKGPQVLPVESHVTFLLILLPSKTNKLEFMGGAI